MTVKDAVTKLNEIFAQHLKEESAGLWGDDVNSALNAASRIIVKAMREEHGHAWLLDLNKGTYIEWDGVSMIYNFCASHVLPVDDTTVRELVGARLAAPYTGIAADAVRVNNINAAVDAAGGEVLLWT